MASSQKQLVLELYRLLVEAGLSSKEATEALDLLISSQERAGDTAVAAHKVVLSRKIAYQLATKALGPSAPDSEITALSNHYYSLILNVLGGAGATVVLETASSAFSMLKSIMTQLRDTFQFEDKPDSTQNLEHRLSMRSGTMIASDEKLARWRAGRAKFFVVKLSYGNAFFPLPIGMNLSSFLDAILSDCFQFDGQFDRRGVEFVQGLYVGMRDNLWEPILIEDPRFVRPPQAYFVIRKYLATELKRMGASGIDWVWYSQRNVKDVSPCEIFSVKEESHNVDFAFINPRTLLISKRILSLLSKHYVQMSPITAIE